jgi:phage repressor protein C with HTH and peptisase S24 domain
MGTGKIIKDLLKEKGLKQKDLALALNENPVNITRWLTEMRRIPENAYPLISEYLNISIDKLMNIDTKEQHVKTVPIIGTASCGACDVNTLQDFTMKTIVPENEWNKDLYAVVANGDSMATEIYDGDIAIIDPNIKVLSGDMAYYKIDDESAIKIFVNDEENNMFQFIPFSSNDCFKTKSIRLDDDTLFDRLTMHKVVQVVSIKKNNRAARLKMIGR